MRYIIFVNWDLTKIKHLHLIRCEVTSPSQDCVLVLYSTWNRVRVAKVGVGVSVTVGIVINTDVMPSTKCWTITWVPVNCIWWSRHHALKWSKTFFVAEWKYERIGSETITITGIWITRKEIQKYVFGHQCLGFASIAILLHIQTLKLIKLNDQTFHLEFDLCRVFL